MGDVDYIQSQVPLNDLIANLSTVTESVYATGADQRSGA